MKKLNALFLTIADYVSYGMGTPPNIIFWIVAVAVWFLLFALNPSLQSSSFLPSWFTSNAFNFPLNTVTTLLELFIGFLVAAAANRSERELRKLIETMNKTIKNVEHINKQQDEMLKMLIAYQTKEIEKEEVIIEKIAKQK